MKAYRAFEIKWWHLALGLGGLVAIVFGIVYFFMSKEGPSMFVEDATDIVD